MSEEIALPVAELQKILIFHYITKQQPSLIFNFEALEKNV